MLRAPQCSSLREGLCICASVHLTDAFPILLTPYINSEHTGNGKVCLNLEKKTFCFIS